MKVCHLCRFFEMISSQWLTSLHWMSTGHCTVGLVCPIIQNDAAVRSSVLLQHRIPQHHSTLQLVTVGAAVVDAAGTLVSLCSVPPLPILV